MKSVLISIQPKWCELIASGQKTMLLSKTRPKIETPFKCYIYATKGKEVWFTVFLGQDREVEYLSGKVIGEFVCNYIAHSNKYLFDAKKLTIQNLIKSSCMSFEEINKYRGDKNIYAWHISDLKIYDEPKELREFRVYNEELHKRFEQDEDYCCYDGTNEYGELMNECSLFNESVARCYSCWEEWGGWCHRVTRPPRSWQYVEELIDTGV